ncbi:hypothetical protein F8M41_004158 [Gigaspora margarita]|uniref:Uncharacterized protein n=1 Tax=Gigaspora margarita TaxID=4874 RepID=A0A8H3XAV4_GIGMA|nr:hypothetical protein F8M41_004158 [Gigaspora margarita]
MKQHNNTLTIKKVEKWHIFRGWKHGCKEDFWKEEGSVKFLFAFDEAYTLIKWKIDYLNPSKRVVEERFKLSKPFYLLNTVNMDMNRKLRYVPALEESEDLHYFFNMEDLCGVHYDYLLMKLKGKTRTCYRNGCKQAYCGKSFIHLKKESQN